MGPWPSSTARAPTWSDESTRRASTCVWRDGSGGRPRSSELTLTRKTSTSSGSLLANVSPSQSSQPSTTSSRGDALARTGWYNVTFYNFIQWEEGTQLYESAQW